MLLRASSSVSVAVRSPSCPSPLAAAAAASSSSFPDFLSFLLRQRARERSVHGNVRSGTVQEEHDISCRSCVYAVELLRSSAQFALASVRGIW